MSEREREREGEEEGENVILSICSLSLRFLTFGVRCTHAEAESSILACSIIGSSCESELL